MEELIRKLEAASEGSRLLDRDIFLAVNPDWLERGIELSDGTIPRFCTSLDAALPGEEIYRVERIGDDKDNYLWTAYQVGYHTGTAKTEALARRIAALRARQQ